MARAYAVTRSATVALRFIPTQSDVTIQMFVDGNGNGVRNADIIARVDLPLDLPVRLSELFSDVSMSAGDGGDPIRIGNTNLMSFTPIGTATPGTIFVRGGDGSQMSVRVFGATGRTRVLRYDPQSRDWVDSI